MFDPDFLHVPKYDRKQAPLDRLSVRRGLGGGSGVH